MSDLQPKKEYTNGIHSKYTQLLYGDGYLNLDNLDDVKIRLADLERASQYLVGAIFDLSETELASLSPLEYKKYLKKAVEIKDSSYPLS